MKTQVGLILIITAMVLLLLMSAGCSAVGANIRLEKMNLGTISMEGKPLDGLPSDKVNLNLDVATQTVKVVASDNKTVLTLVPSGATITIEGESISFKGFKPDQVKVEWAPKPAE